MASVRNEIVARKRELNNNGVLSFPKNLGAHATLLVFKKYKYQSPGTRSINKVSSTTLSREELSGGSILLPLPKEIRDSYRVKIDTFDQGMFGDAISQGGNYLMSDGTIDTNSILENMGVPSTSTIVSTASGAVGGLATRFLSSRTGGIGGAALGALIPGSSNIATSLEAGAGATVNPKQALHFQGIDMKTHSFSWTMAPTSPDESETIVDITNTLKRNALPSYGNIGPFKRALLNYPSTVDIYFFGIQQEYFMYFKTCMIDNLSINYAPQGMAVLRGGKPAMVNLSISLKEMDIHTAEDYGGTSTDTGIRQTGGRNEF